MADAEKGVLVVSLQEVIAARRHVLFLSASQVVLVFAYAKCALQRTSIVRKDPVLRSRSPLRSHTPRTETGLEPTV